MFLVSLDGSDRRNLFGPDTRDSRTQEIGSKGFIKGIQIQEEKVQTKIFTKNSL